MTGKEDHVLIVHTIHKQPCRSLVKAVVDGAIHSMSVTCCTACAMFTAYAMPKHMVKYICAVYLHCIALLITVIDAPAVHLSAGSHARTGPQ